MPFTTNMITNIACLIQACKQLNIPYTFLDKNQNLVKVHVGKGYFFSNSSAPFNAESTFKICRDKEFTYHVVKDVIRCPKTIGFLDPYNEEKYDSYKTANSYEEISAYIEKEFSLPVVVKSNFGARGTNVFKCNTAIEVLLAVKKILDPNSKSYSYVCLAQEYIHPQAEYRIVFFNERISFAYLKDNTHASFEGNLSPLHWADAKAITVEDRNLLSDFSDFIVPAVRELQLVYAGFDVLRDTRGQLWLIEINTALGFEYFVRDNGMDRVISLYKEMLLSFQSSTPFVQHSHFISK